MSMRRAGSCCLRWLDAPAPSAAKRAEEDENDHHDEDDQEDAHDCTTFLGTKWMRIYSAAIASSRDA
jgi:hypothetical protein